jgi:CHASE2 domain-containing sensor protein
MTRLERRVFYRSLAIGGLLTLAVLAAGSFGLLDSLEYWFYDQRALHCQLAEPPPTSRLVHLDIDDGSLSPTALGRWPWPRSEIAQILEEIHRAGPTAVGLDVMFAEPQADTLSFDRSHNVIVGKNDDDLAHALADCGNTVLAASFQFEAAQARSDAPARAQELLTENLELPQDQWSAELTKSGADLPKGKSLDDLFIHLRRQAMKARIDQELQRGPATLDDVARRLLPHTDLTDPTLPLNELLSDQYALSTAEHAVERFSSPPLAMTLPAARGTLNVVPLTAFSRAAACVAFANYDIFDNAAVRSIPLYVEFNHRLYPQMALAIGCVMRGADPAAVHFEGSTAVIPAPGGAIRIPTFTFHSRTLGRDVPLIAAVPWFGTRQWETMYDWPNHREAAAHISIAAIWDICAHNAQLVSNCQTIDLAIDNILNNSRPNQLALDPDQAGKYASDKLDPADFNTRQQRALATLKDLKDWQDMFAQTADKDLSPDDRAKKIEMNDAVTALNATLEKTRDIQSKIDARRHWLAAQIGGKGTLIGYTATGFQDQVTTSLHLRCPGVVVHGVIVNAILTGNWWKVPPFWVTGLLTIIFGMAAATLQGRFKPLRASFFVFALLLGYALVNGFILFDWHKWVVGMACPSVAIVIVWAGCTLDRLIVEGIERNRIAMENAVISKEMDLAKQVQVALIPTRAPTIVGLESAGWALTASVTGGDCYDLWELPDGRLAILLADASGHGLAPAMIVSQVRTLARSLCEFENHPHGLLARINARVVEDLESTRFVTAFCGYLASDGTLEWASAGHGPMYWTPGNGSGMLALDSTGLPLGVSPECFFEPPQPCLKLGENGAIIVFSDGIFEAPGPDGKMFGVERVKEILEKTCGQPCNPMIVALREAVQKWQQKIEPVDDQTIVVVRRVATPA